MSSERLPEDEDGLAPPSIVLDAGLSIDAPVVPVSTPPVEPTTQATSLPVVKTGSVDLAGSVARALTRTGSPYLSSLIAATATAHPTTSALREERS